MGEVAYRSKVRVELVDPLDRGLEDGLEVRPGGRERVQSGDDLIGGHGPPPSWIGEPRNGDIVTGDAVALSATRYHRRDCGDA